VQRSDPACRPHQINPSRGARPFLTHSEPVFCYPGMSFGLLEVTAMTHEFQMRLLFFSYGRILPLSNFGSDGVWTVGLSSAVIKTSKSWFDTVSSKLPSSLSFTLRTP
jgi:hypothetical protein